MESDWSRYIGAFHVTDETVGNRMNVNIGGAEVLANIDPRASVNMIAHESFKLLITAYPTNRVRLKSWLLSTH